MLWPLLAPVVVVTLISALFYGLLRFRVPAEVSLVVLAAVAVVELLDRRRATTARTRGFGPEPPTPQESPV